MIATLDSDNRLPAATVLTVLGGLMREFRHSEGSPCFAQAGMYPFAPQEIASLPNVGRLENTLFSRLKI